MENKDFLTNSEKNLTDSQTDVEFDGFHEWVFLFFESLFDGCGLERELLSVNKYYNWRNYKYKYHYTEKVKSSFQLTDVLENVAKEIEKKFNLKNVESWKGGEEINGETVYVFILTLPNPLIRFLPVENCILPEKDKTGELSFCFLGDKKGDRLPLSEKDSRFVSIFACDAKSASNLVLSALYSVISAYTPEEVKLVIFDGMGAYSPLDKVPHLLHGEIVKDYALLYPLVCKLQKEVERRTKLLKEANVKSIYEYNGLNEEKLPEIVFAISDLLTVREYYGPFGVKFMAKLSNLISDGNAVGLKALIPTQTVGKNPFEIINLSALRPITQVYFKLNSSFKFNNTRLGLHNHYKIPNNATVSLYRVPNVETAVATAVEREQIESKVEELKKGNECENRSTVYKELQEDSLKGEVSENYLSEHLTERAVIETVRIALGRVNVTLEYVANALYISNELALLALNEGVKKGYLRAYSFVSGFYKGNITKEEFAKLFNEDYELF